MKDEIIEELWKIKDEFAKEQKYDLKKIVSKLRAKEKKEKNCIKNLSKNKVLAIT